MDVLVLGSGKIGRACVREFGATDMVDRLIIVDKSSEALSAIPNDIDAVSRCIDVTAVNEVAPLMELADCAVGATTPAHYLPLTEAAINTGTHWVDLGGDEAVLQEQCALDARANRAGVSVVPASGLAPGVCNMLATYGAEQLDSVEKIAIRIGGLPLDPQPPLDYSLEFSVKALVAEYTTPVEVIRDGSRTKVSALGGIESLHIDQVGQLEAFFTAGALANLPKQFESDVEELTYKTLRYPGHRQKIEVLREMGLFDNDPIEINDAVISPRAVIENRLEEILPSGQPDLVVGRITVSGQDNGEPKQLIYELYDEYHEATNMSAMMRTTAFPTVEIAKLAMTDQLRHGVTPAEGDVPVEPVVEFMRDRGIEIKGVPT